MPASTASTAESVTRTVEDEVVTAELDGGDARVRMTNDSVSTRARSGETTVGLEGLGTGNASGSFSSPVLGDGTVDPLRTDLCATGLNGSASPLDVTVDGEAERVGVAFERYLEPMPRETTAGEVTAPCTG